MLDTPEEIVQWLRSEPAKRALHHWVNNFKRASYISQTDLMTDALQALADIVETQRQEWTVDPKRLE